MGKWDHGLKIVIPLGFLIPLRVSTTFTPQALSGLVAGDCWASWLDRGTAGASNYWRAGKCDMRPPCPSKKGHGAAHSGDSVKVLASAAFSQASAA